MTTKITKLTPEQEADLSAHYQEWLAVGRNCAPLDRERTTKAIGAMYAAMGGQRPAGLFFSSPMMCLLAWGVLANTKLRSQLDSQLNSQLDSQLYSQLDSQLYSQLRSQLDSQLCSQLDSQLRSQLDSQLYSQLRSQLDSQLGYRWAGQHWVQWQAFYNFARKIGVKYAIEDDRRFDLWIEEGRSCHWWWPYKGLFIASERHTELHTNPAGQLHCETGMACAYSDGWGVYALNGIQMKAEHILTPAEKLNAADILKEQSVDVRRELIRKVGVEMMLAHLPHQSLDKQGDYELLKIDFPGLAQDTRFLKMLNPSIGVWHLEGVERSCNTVEQAINWRAGVFGDVDWKPAQLT